MDGCVPAFCGWAAFGPVGPLPAAADPAASLPDTASVFSKGILSPADSWNPLIGQEE